ncbi:MAG: hypothetical protein IT518_05920 [Burkholderiales bacterium]|nr:hypothetical protein [Burkholderiales bacterium]
MDKAPLSLELVPMDPADSPAEPAPAAPAVPSRPEAAAEMALDSIEILPVERPVPIAKGTGAKLDPYAAQAAREYAEGHIDTPLWNRAMTQANGDKTAAAAIYVRSRATALRLFVRHPDPRQEARPRGPAPTDGPRVEPGTLFARYRTPIIVATLCVLAIGGAIFAFTRASTPPSPVVAAAPAVAAKSAGNTKAQAPAPTPPGPDLSRKVQELRDAGNWNLMVLYAVEWTRKDPDNAAAWDALRFGYLRLKQYDDAASAASKATQLAPNEPKLWRSLAEVHVERDDPVQALAAFEEAAARNDHDLDSLYQVGLLSARLGRPQAARAAFDRALAAKPGDAVAQCLRTAVAQMPPARDTYTMAVQIRQIDNRCHGRG